MNKDFWKRGKVLGVICMLGFIFLVSSCANQLHKEKFVISGIDFQVVSSHAKAAAIAQDEFKRLDAIVNINNPQSELSRLNTTFDAPVKVSPELFELLKLGNQVYTMTGGAFDYSHGNLYAFWKNFSKDPKQPAQRAQAIAESKDKGGMKYVILDESGKTVTIKKQGLKIDLSAITKGYMVDKVAAKLRAGGINSALISAGSDIYCLGMRGKKPWSVGLKNPKELEGIIEAEMLVDEGIGSAGNIEHFFDLDGKLVSGLIDPRTGSPVSGNILNVTVITKNCTTAESLSAAFFVMGLEQTKAFLTKVPSTMRVFVVTKDGTEKKVHILR